MSTVQYIFLGLMIVSLLPALYSITRGWLRDPSAKVQRRSATAMLVSAIGMGITLLGGGIYQLLERNFLLAGSLLLCVLLLVLSGVLARTHVRAAQHLVTTGERLVFTDAEDRRYRTLLRSILVLAFLIVGLFIGAMVTGVLGAR